MKIHDILNSAPQMSPQQMKAVLLPGLPNSASLDGIQLPQMEGVTDTNVLGQRANTLWQGLASKAIAKFTTRVAPLQAFATDISTEQVNAPAGVNPRVYVKTVSGVGPALRNLKNWNQTAIQNGHVPVDLTRISRPFGMTYNDLMHGETIELLVEGAINAVVLDVFNMLQEFVSKEVATGNVDVIRLESLGAFTPEYVTTQLSAMFSQHGSVESLVLTPDATARITPHNAFMFPLTNGVYGIDEYHTTAHIKHALTIDDDNKSIYWAPSVDAGGNVTHAAGTGAAFGIACQKRAAVFSARTPVIEGSAISVRSLGTLAGIPLLLKSWEEPGTEYIMNSVEALAGFALTFGDVMKVLTTATAPAAAA